MAWKYTYEEMLDRAFKNLPEQTAASSRFEIPEVKGSVQGNRTVVSNIQQIAKALSRPVEHLLKFMLRELATTGDLKEGNAIFMGKFGAAMLNQKIVKYVKEFVTCEQCGKPDTTLTKDKGITFKRCEACGAKKSVRSIK